MTAGRLAVSFDVGQTLAELDTAWLAERLRGHDVHVEAAALETAAPLAYAAYDRSSVRSGHPWTLFMRTLLEAVHVDADRARRAADALLIEQPTKNLWRRPIHGMVALCRDLVAAGVDVGVISNSEGHLFTLLEQMGLAELFRVVGDSGRLGVEKPDRRIFDWFAAEIGYPSERIVHIGDSPTADVDGAIAAGMKAIWFDPGVRASAPPRSGVPRAISAAEVRIALVELGVDARGR